MSEKQSRSTSARRTVLSVSALVLFAVTALALTTGPPTKGNDARSLAPAVPVPVAQIRKTELVVRTGDGLGLAATLRIPVTSTPAPPAMVLVHGGGPGRREDYRTLAETFASVGIATLTYDKRTVGYSLTERSYAQLADDAVAAAELLRAQRGIDPRKVGMWGLSEGGWVAPLAASRAPRTAFLVVVGANGLAPLRQQTWAEAVKMQAVGVRGSLVDAASTTTYRLVNSMGLFPEPYYDPGPVLRRLTLPVLGIWGALDRSTPPVESVAAFREGLEAAGNRHYVLRAFAGAGHTLHTTSDGFHQGAGFVPGYVELVGSWVSAAAAGTPQPSTVIGAGEQPRYTADVPPAAWHESAPAHGVALGLMLVGFVGFTLVAAIRQAVRFRRPGTRIEPAPVSARVVAGAGLASVVGTLVYLAQLTITRGGAVVDPGPMLAGRPLPWLVLQALAATTLLASTVLTFRLVGRQNADQPEPGRPDQSDTGVVGLAEQTPRSGGERVRLTLLLVAAVAFLPWSLHWGLLLP